MSTRSVRLAFLCAATTLVACGQPAGPATPANPANTVPAAPGAGPEASSGNTALSVTIEPSLEAARPDEQDAAAPQAPAAAPPRLEDFPQPRGLEAGRPALDAAAQGDADNAAELGKQIVGGEKLIGVESSGTRQRTTGFQALGFWWGGTDVADQIYGYFGNTYASLYYDDGYIYGTLDGRSVYIEDGENYLRGSIGWSSVSLYRRNGWFSSTVSGTFGGHYVNLAVGSRRLRGYEGNVYLNTGTSWDGRTLAGTYGGYNVKVTNNAGTMSGYFGYKNVRVNSSWSTFSGYVGNKAVNLRSDMTSGAFLRRMPLLAADDWMLVGAMTELFD